MVCRERVLLNLSTQWFARSLNTLGKLTPTAACSGRLCVDGDGVRSIGLEPRTPKCGIYGGDKELVTAEAANCKLQIAHQLDGLTTVGTPLGSTEYVSSALGRCAVKVETLVDTLVQLPRSAQSQFLLLRASLKVPMTHFIRTVPVPLVAQATHMHCADAAVCRGAAAMLDLQCPRGRRARYAHGWPEQGVQQLG